jgi:hypothetical protein
MVMRMIKILSKSLALAALLAVAATASEAMPQWPAAEAALPAKAVRLAHSPLPPRLRQGADLLLVRDMRQQGGACWSHCYNIYDNCMNRSEKSMCVAQIKTCMETCDRLSGVSSVPTQRTSNSNPPR